MTERKADEQEINVLDSSEVLYSLDPSPARAAIATLTLVLLAGFLFYIGFAGSSQFIASRIAFPVLGIASLLSARKIYSVSQIRIFLTPDALLTQDGTLIAKIGNIETVETGMLAMKPSNGFLVILKKPMKWSWHPGLWWRFGKRIGIGGITSKHGSKAMATAIISLMNTD